VSGLVAARRPGTGDRLGPVNRLVRRNGWASGLLGLFALLLVLTKLIHPDYGAFDLENLASGAMPIALAAAAQAVIVIAGGIDLSVGAMMALTNVTAAVLMKHVGDPGSVGVVALVLLLGASVGTANGLLVVTTRVPDIVVTLATSFVWGGAALLILPRPGGAAAEWLKSLTTGGVILEFVPKALVVLVIATFAVWIPLRRSNLGLAMYAVGSDRLAAFRSGVDVPRTKVLAYAVGGLFAAGGGLALTSTTGIGTPVTGAYTLLAVTAIVLGGVSLAGGRGGLVGPLTAALILALLRIDLLFIGVDANLSVVVQGGIMILVVMVGGFLTLRRARA
jgi:ribose transport system permease protein